MSIYNGLNKIKLYVWINIFSNIASAIILVFLVLKMEVIGAFYALAINQIFSLLINILFFVIYKPFEINWIFKKFIKENLKKLSKELGFKTVYPNLKFCGDNAAMIAWAGIQRFKKNMIDDFNVSAKSRWPLDKNAPYMKGPGLKL